MKYYTENGALSFKVNVNRTLVLIARATVATINNSNTIYVFIFINYLK